MQDQETGSAWGPGEPALRPRHMLEDPARFGPNQPQRSTATLREIERGQDDGHLVRETMAPRRPPRPDLLPKKVPARIFEGGLTLTPDPQVQGPDMEDERPQFVEAPLPSGAPPATEAARQTDVRDVEFSLFYKDQMPRLVAHLINNLVPPPQATDVAQEAMTRAYRDWDKIDSPKAWVRTVALRHWWDISKINSREKSEEDVYESADLISEEDLQRIVNRSDFLRLIQSITPRQRQILAWTYDGFEPTEIAALLRENPATIRSNLRHARAALERKIDRNDWRETR